MYKRSQYQTIMSRLQEPRKFLQGVVGPRQVGKSTVVKQVLADLPVPYQAYQHALPVAPAYEWRNFPYSPWLSPKFAIRLGEKKVC